MPRTLFPDDVLFGIIVAFLFGVLSESLGWNRAIVSLLLLSSFVVAFFLLRHWYPSRLALIFLLFFLVFCFGMAYYRFFIHRKEASNILPYNRTATFFAFVSDEPQPSDKGTILSVISTSPRSGSFTVFIPSNVPAVSAHGTASSYAYGEILKVRGMLGPPKTEGGDPGVFPRNVEIVAEHKGFWLREKLIDAKLWILSRFEMVLGKNEAALMGGIAFGSKVNFAPDLKQAMALSGTTHLVAISGYNITIIVVAVSKTLGKICSRRKTFYLTLAAILLFLFMAGFQASAIRAAIMGFFALLAKEMGKVYSVRNPVAITAFLMVLYDPTELTHNVGFILSFLSLLGIVYLSSPLKHFLHYKDEGFLGWRENALTTASAQLMVLPVLIHIFGQFSLTAIGANILVLGTVPFTMLLGFLLVPLSILSSILFSALGKIAGIILSYQLHVITLFATLAVPLPVKFETDFSIAIYYVVIGIFIWVNAKNHDATAQTV